MFTNSLILADQLIERLSQPTMITGMVLAVVGIAFALLAKKITRIVRKKQEIEEADKLYLTIKAFALVLILVALIVMIIPAT